MQVLFLHIFLDPILADLDIANSNTVIKESRFLSIVLNAFLGRQEKTDRIIKDMNCGTSAEYGAEVHNGVMIVTFTIFGKANPVLKNELRETLISNGCNK